LAICTQPLLRKTTNATEEEGLFFASTDEQSMKFYCSSEANAECDQYCNADFIYILQVFLVEDEFDDRESWSGSHIQVVANEKR
jgi:hypothetical protein